MKPLFSRADLVRVAASVGAEGLDQVAWAHGFEKEPRVPPPAKASRSAQPDSRAALDDTTPEVALAQTPFWQPRSIEFHGGDEAKARAREAAEAAEAAEVAGAWRRGTDTPPTSPPLTPWRRLGPLLQRALTVDRRGQRIDLLRLVRRIADGRQITPLPRLRRRGWVPVEVIVDRPLRLAPFWSDQAAVVRELERVLGRQGVAVQVFANGPGSARDEATPRRRPVVGGVPMLVLTDLGWYAGADERSAWLRMARALLASGKQVVALVPVPRSRWTPELARAWRVIPWERPVGCAGDDAARATRVDRLLVHLAPAMRIERGLLRTIRWLLPRAEADVGVEADVWAHPVLGDMFPEYRLIDPGAIVELRRRFAAEVPAADQARVIAALRAWHWNRDRMPEAWHLEVLALERTLSAGAAQSAGITAMEVEQAESFMTWLFRDVEQGETDDEAADTLRRWCHFVVEQAPRSMWDPATRVGEALQKISFQVGGVEVPDADPKLRAAIDGRDDRPEPREYRLTQKGCALEVAAAGWSAMWPRAPQSDRSPLATVVAAQSALMLVSSVVKEGELALARPGERLVAPPRGAIELRTDRTTLRLEPLTRPSWARAIGRDPFGLWAELFFAGVSYRMRWIPPGRFVMGSPTDEPGRREDEGPQHEVTITRGYWLGETPVTQALWQAVTGTNPSQFKTPERPVEQVSWNECQKAIAGLNKMIPNERGEFFRMPTEAEWEYACRAGTTGATYAGPIEILGANDASVLDDIAWYEGNSGVDYDLDEGEDSSKGPDKQHEDSKAGTRRTGQKQPNQWGLHDMLGNVWEWCSDWNSSYSSTAQQDPVGPAAGENRVIRGGSWDNRVWFARAAARKALDASSRYSNLGLRLVRDQGVQQNPDAFVEEHGGAESAREVTGRQEAGGLVEWWKAGLEKELVLLPVVPKSKGPWREVSPGRWAHAEHGAIVEAVVVTETRSSRTETYDGWQVVTDKPCGAYRRLSDAKRAASNLGRWFSK